MALDVDLSEWPLACIAADDEGADGALIGELGALLDRRERFGLVLDVGKQSRDDQAVLAAWLQTHRVRAKRYVVGCAMVVPEATLDRNRDLIAAHPDVYPFPAWVAATLGECRTWVEGVLATSGPNGTRPSRR